MLKTLKIMATTALIAGIPLSSSLAGMFVSAGASGLFTKQQDNNIHLTAPASNKILTTVPPTSNKAEYLKEGSYTGKLKGQSVFGGGGVLGVGYAMGDENSASVSIHGGYDWFGTHKFEEDALKTMAKDSEVYDESAMYGVIRASLPFMPGNSFTPYAAIEIGMTYQTMDDSDMDNGLTASLLVADGTNGCTKAGAASPGNRACPGYGNIKTSDDKTDTLAIAGGAVGIQYTLNPGMLLTAEYAVHFGFQKVKFEEDDSDSSSGSKNNVERDYLKQRATIGMKYHF